MAEESAPVEAEICREAEVIRQVLESDVPLERSLNAIPPLSAPTTTNSSPALRPQDGLDDVDDMLADSGLGISSSTTRQHQQQQQQQPQQQQPLKGLLPSARLPWDAAETMSTSNSSAYTTPPLPPFRPRGSSTISEDMSMDSPAASVAGFVVPNNSSNGNGSGTASGNGDLHHQRADGGSGGIQHGPQPPSAAEITRRINNKRRRDDDLDPVALKRRAVSPSISVHNSPVMQSPMQRDAAPWGSRPGSNSGEKAGGSSAASDAGSIAGGNPSAAAAVAGKLGPAKGRVGFQGMVDTNDGLMRMSIE